MTLACNSAFFQGTQETKGLAVRSSEDLTSKGQVLIGSEESGAGRGSRPGEKRKLRETIRIRKQRI